MLSRYSYVRLVGIFETFRFFLDFVFWQYFRVCSTFGRRWQKKSAHEIYLTIRHLGPRCLFIFDYDCFESYQYRVFFLPNFLRTRSAIYASLGGISSASQWSSGNRADILIRTELGATNSHPGLCVEA
jgi:hypothetical protein